MMGKRVGPMSLIEEMELAMRMHSLDSLLART